MATPGLGVCDLCGAFCRPAETVTICETLTLDLCPPCLASVRAGLFAHPKAAADMLARLLRTLATVGGGRPLAHA